MATIDAGGALTPFGFTSLESQIYAYLIGQPPVTGYRIAQAIGKPVANTYKAIQTLQAKGAIVVDDGESRLCRAVASDELLARLTREFEKRRAEASATFTKIAQGEGDQRVYSLRSANQAMQRARQMIADAKQIILIAAQGQTIQGLAGDLAEAGARGLDVTIKSETDLSIPRVDGFIASREDDLLHHGAFFRLVTDGTQCLAGRLGPIADDADFIWSQSPVLSLVLHEGLAAEISVLAVAERLEDGAGPKRLARALNQVRSASATVGFVPKPAETPKP